MRLAAILLAIVAMTHYGYEPLASLYADQRAAARAIFYALRGVEGVALFALVGLLARRADVAVVCLWGAVEEGQTAVCRVAAGIGSPVNTQPFTGLCGAQAYWLGILAAAVIAVIIATKGNQDG